MFALRNKYPIDDEHQIKTAMNYFDSEIEKLDIKSRMIVSQNIKKQASLLNIDYTEHPWVVNYSRPLVKGAKLSPDFNNSIKRRKEMCKNAELNLRGKKFKASDILDSIEKSASTTHPVQVMYHLEEFDKIANLQSEYDVNINDPVMSVFGSESNPEYDSVKIASDITDYDINRCICNKSKMDKVAKQFGEDFRSNFINNPHSTIQKMGSIEVDIIRSIIKG